MESKVITVGRNEYKVHPEGLIESRHRMLRPQDNSKGYKYVCLGYGEGGYKNFYIHRLVAEAFIDNPLNLPEINHIDGNRANNMVSNLEWCDRVYNVRDYVSKGRGKYSTKSVKQIDEQGTTIKTWLSLKEASKDLGCTPELLGMAANGRIKWDKGVPDGVSFRRYETAYCSLITYTWELPLLWAGMCQAKSLSEPMTQQGNKKLNEKRIHPCHKPVMLYDAIYLRFGFEGMKVIDTHLGGGSNRISCNKLNYEFVAAEIDKEYFDKQEKRYRSHVSKLRIANW